MVYWGVGSQERGELQEKSTSINIRVDLKLFTKKLYGNIRTISCDFTI